MSPLQIEILLHYHARACDYREGDFSAPAVRQTIDEFKGPLKLLELMPDPRPYPSTYQLTERGRAYVNALLMLPLPVANG